MFAVDLDNHSIMAEVGLMSYCGKEWKGESKQARQMKEVGIFSAAKPGIVCAI